MDGTPTGHDEGLRERELRIAELELEAAQQRARIERLEAPAGEERLRELRDIVEAQEEALVEQRRIIESQSSLLEELGVHLRAEPACGSDQEPSGAEPAPAAGRLRAPPKTRHAAHAGHARRGGPPERPPPPAAPAGGPRAPAAPVEQWLPEDGARARHGARVELPRLRPTSASRGLRVPAAMQEKAAGKAYGLARAGLELPRAGLG